MKTLLFSLIISYSISSSAIAEPFGRLSDHWYIGASIGQSNLEPDTDNHWDISNNKGSSKKIYIGKDISKQIGLEVFWADLGAAKLKNQYHTGKIHYSAVGANVTYNSPYHIGGFRPLGKLGIAKFDTQSEGDVKDEQENNLTLFVGVGAEYDISENLSLRTEFERFADDINVFSLGFNWSSRYRDHTFSR